MGGSVRQETTRLWSNASSQMPHNIAFQGSRNGGAALAVAAP